MMKQTQYTLSELARLLEIDYRGDGNTKITGVAPLQQAQAKQISFLDNSYYRKFLNTTKASAVILSAENAEAASTSVLITPNPYFIYAKVAELFDDRPYPKSGIHPTAIIGKNCTIHPTAKISAYCVIGDNCLIGAETCLWPQVVLYDGTQLGSHVIIQSGAILGSDGFGNARNGARWYKVPQLGRVIVGDDVEIGANTTIDRGALGDTIIEEGVRLDNQIQVAHNVHIGAHTAIAACVAIAGSVTIGKHCLIGGGVGIAGHLSICDRSIITAMTGVSKSITEPGIYSSATIAQKNIDWRKMTARLRHLDELFDRVTALEHVLQKKEG